MRLFTIATIACLITPSASAQFLVRNYAKFRSNEYFKAYVFGVGEGYMHANMLMSMKEAPTLYCQPEKLALSQDDYLRILDRVIKDQSQSLPPNTEIAMALLVGLSDTFPCQSSQSSP